MSLKSRAGGLVGYAFLAVGALGGAYGAAMIGYVAFAGATAGRLTGVLAGFGLLVTCGLTGYVVRKTVAGQVLPSDVDTSVAFRGGP